MSDNIFIISIDPGTNTGIAVYEISSKDFTIVSIETTTIVLSTYGNTLNKLFRVRDVVTKLVEAYDPHLLAVEAAFMNVRFPKAVMQLSQLIGTIELAAKTAKPSINIFEYAPKYIKKIIATGIADKDNMSLAVKNNKELNKYVDVDKMSEHEIDAVSIGYVLLLEIRQTPFILYSII